MLIPDVLELPGGIKRVETAQGIQRVGTGLSPR